MSSVSLPSTIALKSNLFGLYMNYSIDSKAKERGYIRFDGSNVFSPSAKFEVVMADTDTELVHIRCRKNRKFLRRRSTSSVYLSPDGDEPEEDQSKWKCTLFQAQTVEEGNSNKVYLMHVQSQNYATAWDQGGVRFLRLYCGFGHQGVFDVLDLESMVILPKQVAIKGKSGDYLRMVEFTNSLQPTFSSTDKGRSGSWFVISTDGDGRLQIMSFYNNKYLRHNSADDWIFADSAGDATDLSTWFWPIKLNSSTLAIKSLNNGKFCEQFSGSGITYGLKAVNTSTNDWCHFTLAELMLSRRIYNTDFDLKNAIIYGETPLTMASGDATNDTSADNTLQIKLTYRESRSSTWKSSHSWMVGVSVTTSFKIPFIGGTDVTATAEYSGSYKWGETITSGNTVETTYTAIVPAYTRVQVRLLATKGNCDVPYSYYQRDLLYNGQTVIYKKDDGLYTGVNSYNFHYEVTTVKTNESGADLVETTAVQKIAAPELTGPTIVPIPVTSTTSLQLEEETVQEAVAMPLEANQEGEDTLA